MNDPVVNATQRACGRRVMIDPRDREYGYTPKKATSKRTKRYWTTNTYFYDQGYKSVCVGGGWSHWLWNNPIRQWLEPEGIYGLAQYLDEWPGQSYEGTSVRAGAKVLKMLGFIERYEWVHDINTLVLSLLEKGPVVVGTNWYEGMMNPCKGLMRADGEVLGGHCYLLDGVDTTKKQFRAKNSYGTSWGSGGRAVISFADFDRLIEEDGEVCVATERKVSPPVGG